MENKPKSYGIASLIEIIAYIQLCFIGLLFLMFILAPLNHNITLLGSLGTGYIAVSVFAGSVTIIIVELAISKLIKTNVDIEYNTRYICYYIDEIQKNESSNK